MKPAIAVFCHLYYSDSYPDLLPGLRNVDASCIPQFFFNVVDGHRNPLLMEQIKTDFPQAFVFSSPNTGKDIGGKLALMELYLQLEIKSEFILLLHDKTSPEILNGKKWRDELLRITEKDRLPAILHIFKEQPGVGMVCAAEHISDEYDQKEHKFNSRNNELLKTYITQWDLKNKEFMFVAGNMFWIRSSIFECFFKKHSPLEIRSSLERGNVSDVEAGTHTHSLERIFSWIALDQGYTIKGIPQ